MNFAILSKILALSNQGLCAAIKSLGSIESIFDSHPDDLGHWFSQKDIFQIQRWRKSTSFQKEYARLEAILSVEGASQLVLGDKDYPPTLAEIPDPPAVLFVVGDASTLCFPQIAIVGSRNCTVQGRRIAQDFAAELALMGFCITSGLALGIDTAAHQGALKAGGKTCAVMGAGLDVIYPARNKALSREIVETSGALVTEFLPGSPPQAWHFPQRNRIVTGLSLAVLVIEASERSGSLISARLAVEQGREVFAVPGSPMSPVSAGCNHLIREGAILVTSPDHMVDHLQPMFEFQSQAQGFQASKVPDKDTTAVYSDEARWLMEQMGFEPISVDELCVLCERDSSEITTILAELELEGKVVQTAVGYQRCV